MKDSHRPICLFFQFPGGVTDFHGFVTHSPYSPITHYSFALKYFYYDVSFYIFDFSYPFILLIYPLCTLWCYIILKFCSFITSCLGMTISFFRFCHLSSLWLVGTNTVSCSLVYTVLVLIFTPYYQRPVGSYASVVLFYYSYYCCSMIKLHEYPATERLSVSVCRSFSSPSSGITYSVCIKLISTNRLDKLWIGWTAESVDVH